MNFAMILDNTLVAIRNDCHKNYRYFLNEKQILNIHEIKSEQRKSTSQHGCIDNKISKITLNFVTVKNAKKTDKDGQNRLIVFFINWY